MHAVQDRRAKRLRSEGSQCAVVAVLPRRGEKDFFDGGPHLPAADPTPNTRVSPRTALGRHVMDEQAKDAARDLAENRPRSGLPAFFNPFAHAADLKESP